MRKGYECKCNGQHRLLTLLAAEDGAPVVPPVWYNPLESAAIQAVIDAVGLWAWRAQANDNVTWGPGPADYAASRVDEAQSVTAGEIVGAVNWAAATGWSGFSTLGRCLDTTIVPVPDATWALFIQYSGETAGNNNFAGIYDTAVENGAFAIQRRMRSYNRQTANLVDNAPVMNAGNYAILGAQPYRNGVSEPNPVPGVAPGTTDLSMFMGAMNFNGASNGRIMGELQAVLLCNDASVFTLADIQAIALVVTGSMHNL